MRSNKDLMKIVFAGLLLTPFVCWGGSTAGSIGNDLNNIRGLVKPYKTATLSSGIMGKIIKIPYRMGDVFKKGQSLVQFDCALNNAEYAAAKASLNAETKKYENNLKLLDLNAASQIEVDISESNVKQAEAELQMAKVRVDRCVIKAPYDGRVIETRVNEHESVSPDLPLITILSDQQLEIELIVPSTWLNWLEPDVEFDFRVDETGKDYKAKVAQLGASVDPVSQTIRVKGVFVDMADRVLSGMSGTARFRESY